ncbi:AraC family transcriptional regulator [Gordonia sp. PDNC005]|uniref:AraC family transcriptional regulator n=1 Tax=unclassified Gordonia (in: high G+C Gram-positive bacteria) TaxID=2657482 RepID=UPI001962B2AC|nr:AraC family transcriptional regulator [Gordonia sp. PDNC005]QRY61255.1 AraC family transcriptional regulator [Gordonia sp. PDNC005]
MDWSIPRSAAGVVLLLGLAEASGVEPTACLAGTGLDAAELRRADAEVSPRQELTVITNLVDAVDDPTGLGVTAGMRYQLTTYGMFGFALLSSPTLRSAIDVGLRFLDLTFVFSRIRPVETSDGVELLLDAPDVPERLRRFVVERDAAAVCAIHRDLTGGPAPAVRIGFDEPADSAAYRAAFGALPDFGAPETVIAMSDEQLDVPLPRADTHAAALAQAQCREILRSRSTRSGLAGRVLDLLSGDPAHPPTADDAARALAMSPRTLRHRLAAEGTSYRDLLQEMRRRLAEEMLLSGRLTVGETAQRLGYVEVSSFSQAFRRWTGVGPAEFRRQRT